MSSILFRKIKTGFKMVFKNPSGLIVAFGRNGHLKGMSDRTFLKLAYREKKKKKLNLDNPQTLPEILQWLKLNDRKEIYPRLIDKHTARDIIAEKYGEEYLVPLIGVYDSEEDIPWDKLPEKFVIKCTHGSGCNIVCRDKSGLDIESAKEQLRSWLGQNWFWYGREWPYKSIVPRIIIESFVTDRSGQNNLTDYKFYCFDGEPVYCQVIGGRHVENGENVYYIDFFDMDWNPMPFTGFHSPGHLHPHSPVTPSKPDTFDEMVKISKELSAGCSFVRMDFYETADHLKFGEFTLYPMSGFGEFSPDEWNKKLGQMVKLKK